MIYQKIVSGDTAEALPSVEGVIQPGCNTTQVPLHIPSGTPAGKYTLYTEVIYDVNALRTIHVYWHAGPFNVTK